MNFASLLIFCGFVGIMQGVGAECPGSPAKIHAKCQLQIVFPNTDCRDPIEEIVGRIQGTNDWTDPHNGGAYKLLNATPTSIVGSRRTGNEKYTDLFSFVIENDSSGKNCVVNACSESQVTSVLDFSTNYCNMHNLYCSQGAGCSTVFHDLNYSERYVACTQRDSGKCRATNADTMPLESIFR